MRRWKVTTTQISPLGAAAARTARGRAEYGALIKPMVTTETYRWKWLAHLAAFNVNSFYAFNPIWGMGWAIVEPI